MTIKIAQEAKPQSTTYWRWSVWLEATNEELDDVEEVVWKLHPTFVDPVQRVTSRDTKFKLSTSGWGEFQIVAEVHRKKGKNQTLRHWLRFAESLEEEGSAAVTKQMAPGKAPGKIKIKGRFSGPKPRVFISYTRENAQLASHLAEKLIGHDVEVWRDLDVLPGMDFQSWTRDAIRESDAVVVLVPENQSTWADYEVKAAISADVNIIPVMLNQGAKLPTTLKEYQSIKIKPGIPELIAGDLADRVTGLL